MTKTRLLKMCDALGIGADPKSGCDGLSDLIAAHYTTGDTLPQIEPMLAASLADEASNRLRIMRGVHWVAEEKLDGVRQKMHVTSTGNRFDGRRRSDATRLYTERTDNYPYWRDLKLPGLEGTVLDGEVRMVNGHIDMGSGRTAGTLPATVAIVTSAPEKSLEIQRREGRPEYHVFDLIRVDGRPCAWTFAARRAHLEGIFARHGEALARAGIKFVPQSRDKEGLYADIVRAGGEGVMLKLLSGLYEPGKRVKTLLKWKRVETLDAYITGSVPAEDGNGWAGLVGAFEVSVLDKVTARPVVVGAVQPGTLEFRKAISAPGGTLRPEYLNRAVEVRGQAWTKNLRLSHCVLLRFRPDKDPAECVVDFAPVRRRLGTEDRHDRS